MEVDGGLEAFAIAVAACSALDHLDLRVHSLRFRVRGTRIPVAVVLANLAEGNTVEQIIAEYPSLTEQTIRAAIAYAADLAQERHLDVPA